VIVSRPVTTSGPAFKPSRPLRKRFEKSVAHKVRRYRTFVASELVSDVQGPSEFYCQEDAQACLNSAELILKSVKEYTKSS